MSRGSRARHGIRSTVICALVLAIAMGFSPSEGIANTFEEVEPTDVQIEALPEDDATTTDAVVVGEDVAVEVTGDPADALLSVDSSPVQESVEDVQVQEDSFVDNVALEVQSSDTSSNKPVTVTAEAKKPIAKKSVSKLTVSKIKSKTYTGKALKPVPTIKDGKTKLKKGTHYTLAYKNNKAVGTATVTIKGKGKYTGTRVINFKINKAKNPLTVKAAAKSTTTKAVAKRSVTLAPLTVKGAKGTVSYKKVRGSDRLAINAKNGKVTVKKGTKSGLYKVRVRVSAKGNANYKAGSKAITVKIDVKKATAPNVFNPNDLLGTVSYYSGGTYSTPIEIEVRVCNNSNKTLYLDYDASLTCVTRVWKKKVEEDLINRMVMHAKGYSSDEVSAATPYIPIPQGKTMDVQFIGYESNSHFYWEDTPDSQFLWEIYDHPKSYNEKESGKSGLYAIRIDQGSSTLVYTQTSSYSNYSSGKTSSEYEFVVPSVEIEKRECPMCRVNSRSTGVCSNCHGTKKILDGKYTCPTCQGTGKCVTCNGHGVY